MTVNCFAEGDISPPFVGFGQSGFGRRDNGVHVHDQYTRLKTVWIDLTDGRGRGSRLTGYRARRLSVHRGPAAWTEILGRRSKPRPLAGTRTADVAIVGASFAGLSAVRRVRRLDPTARVVVLDPGRVAEGAAGRNMGFMIDLPHKLSSDDYAGTVDDAAAIARNRQAIAFAAGAVEEYGIPHDHFDRAGKTNGAASAAADAHNVSYAKHLEQFGKPYELLDASEMRKITGSPH